MTRRVRAWRHLLQDRRGTAALEAALVLTFLLVPLLAALAGIGQALLTQYRVDMATHAALMYAWGTPSTATATTVASAAQQGYGTGSGAPLTATASIACYCIDPTGTRTSGTTTTISCSGTCTNANQVLASWVTVNSSASFTPILYASWAGTGWTLSASSTVRIQ